VGANVPLLIVVLPALGTSAAPVGVPEVLMAPAGKVAAGVRVLLALPAVLLGVPAAEPSGLLPLQVALTVAVGDAEAVGEST
jgi:hypothetical protein